MTNTVMPIGDMSIFLPPIQGEFTNLLLGTHLQATTTTSSSRRLEFNEDFSSTIE
jgi:hypothetical protein